MSSIFRIKKKLIVFCLFFIFLQANAQQLPVPRNQRAAYAKATRSMSGSPGKNYWQNSARYRINVDFLPATRLLSGKVEIDYVNNSPDTLKQVWFKLYPNLYKTGTPSLRKIEPEDLGEGVQIDSIWINGKSLKLSDLLIDGTNMVLNHLSIMKGQHVKFNIHYHYTLNKGSHIRTGEIEPGAYFIAYFFPRIAVYDDIDGWNKFPYNGVQEFYNDFCDFEAAITVPRNYVVWATGDLQNCNEVLNETYCKRLADAERSDTFINIIDPSDDSSAITKNQLTNTWKFRASQVPDFAFALSDHYVWQSASLVVDSNTKRRTRVDAVFNPAHEDYYWVGADTRKTVEAMSFVFPKWPFPYSHITVFDGLDQMEYPMMVNDNPVKTRFDGVTLTDHEVFHTMFPFYMGTNETKYAWMDEGWATLGEWLISPLIDSTIIDDYGVLPTERHLGNENDLPVISLSTENSAAYFTNSYPEPAMGYLFVRDLLGDSLFTKALHHYIREWNGKHPIPLDFFNSMNAGSGKNLNWFWKRWFYDTGYADLAITSVMPKLNAYRISITSRGTKPVPIDLFITYVDKTTTRIHKSVSVWEKGGTTTVIHVPGSKKIQSIQLGSTWIPDANKIDNYYTAE